MTRVINAPGRGKLRVQVLVAVLTITLVGLAMFDIAAVTALRKYLLTQTDATLQSVLDQTQQRLTTLLPESRRLTWQVEMPVAVGAYDISFVPFSGKVVNLQRSPGPMARDPAGRGQGHRGRPRCRARRQGRGQVRSG